MPTESGYFICAMPNIGMEVGTIKNLTAQPKGWLRCNAGLIPNGFPELKTFMKDNYNTEFLPDADGHIVGAWP